MNFSVLRVGQTVRKTCDEIEAGTFLLNRLAARRFPRLVFRASPNTGDLRLQVGAEGLAQTFEDPDVRFAVERRIEEAANLRPGSIVIHCPRRATAEKIANVLLVKPGQEAEQVCKLRDLASIDREMFSKHQEAVQAVEQMYRSMWRLAVYVSPECLKRQKEIGKTIGRVIFQQMDRHKHYGEAADLVWRNDLDLEHRVAKHSEWHSDVDVTDIGQALAEVVDELVAEGQLPAWLDEVNLDCDRGLLRQRLAGLPDPKPLVPDAAEQRLALLVQTAGGYFTRRLTARQTKGLKTRYGAAVKEVSPEVFSGVVASLQTSIAGTPANLQRHKGNKMSELVSVIDALFKDVGVALPSRGDEDLFGLSK